jgi:hypothetical protein
MELSQGLNDIHSISWKKLPPFFSNHSYKNYPSFKEILGNFRPVERINLEMEITNMLIISKEEPVSLNPSGKARIHATITKGINNKLRSADTILGMGEVTTIANMICFPQLFAALQNQHLCSLHFLHPSVQ